METRFLRTFLTIIDVGSMAEAARKLNLSSTAVAQQMKVLESEIGAPLLVRLGRSVVPTTVGLRLSQRLGGVLDELQEICYSATNTVLAGNLRVGAVATAISGIIPNMLIALSDSFPDITVSLIPGRTSQLYQGVINGDLDVALIVEPKFNLSKSTRWMSLREEQLVLIAPESVIFNDLQDLVQRFPYIYYDRTSSGGQIADQFLKDNNLRPVPRFELYSLSAICTLVDRKLGVAVIPDWAPPWPEGLRLSKRYVGGPEYMRRIGMFWLPSSNKENLINALCVASKSSSVLSRSGYESAG